MIEDLEERIDALHGAYSLSKRVLAVAAMLASQAMQPGRPYRDGFVTSRNTFQKYYTQVELAGFISEVLNEEPIPVSFSPEDTAASHCYSDLNAQTQSVSGCLAQNAPS